MADNITITPGTGATVRTDDVGGVEIQVVKVALGADGAEDLLLDSGQQTKANSLPVIAASDSKSETNLDIALSALRDAIVKTGATSNTLADVVTALAHVVNIPADPAREGGNLSTLAGKDFATQTTLAAIKTDVDKIPSDPANNGAAITGQSLEAGGSGLFGWLSSLRKAITDRLPGALDGSGYLKIHEQGTATISGTVTSNAGTNLNTSLLALEAGGNLATLAGKDFATQTTLAAIKAKTDNIPASPAQEAGNLATIAGKDFATQTTLAAVKAKTDNLPADPAREGGNLATIAGKDFATQTTLAAIKAKTDNIPTSPSQESGNLATLAGKDFALEGAAITGQSLEAGGSGVLGWLASLRKAITDRLPAALTGSGSLKVAVVEAVTAGENHVGAVSGQLVSQSIEFTRPADTIAYASGDCVSNSTSSTTPMDFTTLARVNAGTGYIVGIRLSTNQKSITPRFRVHLYNASNPTLAVDNAGWQDKYADIAKRLGFWDLPAMITGADTTNSDMSRTLDFSQRIPFVAGNGIQDIYAVLETLDVFTPTSGEKFTLTLYADQN